MMGVMGIIGSDGSYGNYEKMGIMRVCIVLIIPIVRIILRSLVRKDSESAGALRVICRGRSLYIFRRFG